MAVKSV